MSDSIRHHQISMSIAVAAMAFVIFAELMSPGVQFLTTTDGAANGHLFNTLSVVFESILFLAAILAVGGLLGFAFGRRIAWPLIALAVLAVFVKQLVAQPAVGWSLEPQGTPVSPLVYLQPMIVSGASLLALLLLGIMRVRQVLLWIILLALSVPHFILLARLYLVFTSPEGTLFLDSYLIESAHWAAFAGSLFAALLVSARLSSLAETFCGALGALAIVTIATVGGFLGRMGMPRRYMDYPDAFSAWMKVYASAWIGLAALLLSLAVWAAYRPRET